MSNFISSKRIAMLGMRDIVAHLKLVTLGCLILSCLTPFTDKKLGDRTAPFFLICSLQRLICGA
ncbi:MAG: hypothetical protein FJX03_02050 [Alphaproteobacteria bacterium]|nr:hypothetical protein [Alphaproteobacteria bacterium]